MSRVVRSSKYRHVFGTAAKKEECWDNLKTSKSAWDSNKCAANSHLIGVIWESQGGGSFAVIPRKSVGKVPASLPLVAGHKGLVLDIDSNPFNAGVFGSVSEDGNGRIWNIPVEGLTQTLVEPTQILLGHRRKVGTIRFHPTAENLVATSSADFTVKIWDITTGQANLTVTGHADMIQSAEWDRLGARLATCSKDKKLRIVDPRSGEITAEVEAHAGIEGSRCLWLGRQDYVITTGFSKTSDRQFAIWDPRNLATKLTSQNVDTAAGILMPFYDDDTNMLFLAGKGDGNVRYYEIVDDKPYIHYLSEYKSATPQLGMTMLPKLAVNVSACEIDVLLKVCTGYVEPISFTVPRKSDIFQDDIYPPTKSDKPALTAAQWLAGQTAEPSTVSLEGGYVAPPPKELVVEKQVVDEGPKTEAELRSEYEKLKKRVAYLEAEIVKKDQQIANLQG